MKQYYYIKNDQRLGPLSVEELKFKRLQKSTLVWTKGMQDWTVADNINDLKEILVSEPPPLPKKRNTLQKNEFVEIKIHQTTVTNENFDSSYNKETEATFVGVLLLVVFIVLNLSGVLTFNTIENYNSGKFYSGIIIIILRIIITVWVVNIATRKNRNTTGWGWLAFFFPSIALIIIGLLKKLSLKIELDGNLTTDQQLTILLDKANQLYSHHRYIECIEVILSSNNKCNS